MNPNPRVSEWVVSLRKPTTYGPMMPPSCDSETIKPKEAAAAVSLNMIVGSDQKVG
jgi:hypothetical protein